MQEADDRNPRDHPAAGYDVPWTMDPREERAGNVVRHEQRRERDHDQVVEEERPARDEADQVVVGDANERRGATGLPDRSGPFRIRQRDDQEERADDEQDERREPE